MSLSGAGRILEQLSCISPLCLCKKWCHEEAAAVLYFLHGGAGTMHTLHDSAGTMHTLCNGTRTMHTAHGSTGTTHSLHGGTGTMHTLHNGMETTLALQDRHPEYCSAQQGKTLLIL